ncbi:MAG: hypothetical protein HC813_01400 [Planctomycetes bacterium]|nr:hypothetical protein [Planctomycetota bacterium]
MGTVDLSGDPLTTFGPGFTITLSLEGDVNGGAGVFEVTLFIEITVDGFEVSGDGTWIDNVEQVLGRFNIDPADPMVLRDEVADTDGNLCGMDIEGTWRSRPSLSIRSSWGSPDPSPPGGIFAILTFLRRNRTVSVHDASYHDPASTTGAEPVASSSITLPPCGGPVAGLEAWAGNWTFNWYCTATGSGPGVPRRTTASRRSPSRSPGPPASRSATTA